MLRYDPICNGLSREDAPVKQSQSNRTSIKTYIIEQPVTIQRLPYVPSDGDLLVDAGTARATIAASKESPNGTPGYAEKHQNKTVCKLISPHDTLKLKASR